jgi:hypothetical protein
VVTPLESNPERLIGYVLTGSVEALENSGQVPPIREFCRRRNHQLIYVEPETGSSTTLLRQGLWHAVRSLVCYKCAAKDMPVSIDTPEWLKQVFEICPCGEPEGLDGLVVATMGAICTNQANGARLTLSLARLGKHLYVAPEDRCVSCCNPAAAALLRKDEDRN